MAWHTGADGWKPLEELLAGEEEIKAAEPPPPDTAVHISREGEKHGPYKYETAKIHLEGGQLLPTDSPWHEGMEGWKPLAEIYPQVVPGSTGQIAAIPGQSGGVATYSPYDKGDSKIHAVHDARRSRHRGRGAADGDVQPIQDSVSQF